MLPKHGIKTTGELREFLANMLIGIRDGQIEVDKAARMIKTAAQINESFYSEIKVAKVRLEAGQALTDLGRLPINEG